MNWPNQPMLALPIGGAIPSAEAEEVNPYLLRDTCNTNQIHWVDKAGFALFLLATAMLLLRPADWLLPLQNLPIYALIVAACLCLSLPRMALQFSRRSPAYPITLLLFGICATIVLSHLARGSLYDARVGGTGFLKIFIYYLLILSWVDSPARMRKFMFCLCACSLAQTIVGFLEYEGFISLSTLRSIEQADVNSVSGTVSILRRLCGIGIFDDPNDLCMLLVTTTILCYGFTARTPSGRSRLGWFVPMGFSVYAITLTSSRGGFLSLLAAVGTLLVARYGQRRALLAAVLLMPVIVVVFAGRQTRFDLSEDTFQTRLECWNNSLDLIKQSPIFGVGQEQQFELRGAVAHNSFIQGFAELGFVGGACLLGAFGMTLLGLRRTNVSAAAPEMARFRPILMAIVVGYAVGMLTLSRAYTVSPYLVLGLAAAFINLTPRLKPLHLNLRFVECIAAASVLFIAATYLFVRALSV